MTNIIITEIIMAMRVVYSLNLNKFSVDIDVTAARTFISVLISFQSGITWHHMFAIEDMCLQHLASSPSIKIRVSSRPSHRNGGRFGSYIVSYDQNHAAKKEDDCMIQIHPVASSIER